MDSINAPESTRKQPFPTHLVGILEAGTVPEYVPSWLDKCLTLKRTTVPEEHERMTNHNRQTSLEGWCPFSTSTR